MNFSTWGRVARQRQRMRCGGNKVSFSAPSIRFGRLFDAVQTQRLFEDQKTFCDAVPKRSVADIMRDFQQLAPDACLRRFVQANFDIPESLLRVAVPQGLSLEAHVRWLWNALTRQPDDRTTSTGSSLLPLPSPYVVPGGRFREIYYWDSYFTMLGLVRDGYHELAKDMVNNFATFVDQFDVIPNGNRSYYLTRSQPPFFAFMVELVCANEGAVLQDFFPFLLREYRFWMDTPRAIIMPDGSSVLNRYWDDLDVPRDEAYLQDIVSHAELGPGHTPEFYRHIRAACESGWDFTSRWFRDGKSFSTIQTTQIVPVCLNSLMYHLELVLSRASSCPQQAKSFADAAANRQAAMQKYLWNDKFFCDYDLESKSQRENLTAAAMYPLFTRWASPEQAKSTAAAVKKDLVYPGGLVVSPANSNSGQQWDFPNAWAPLQWIAVRGLCNYGLTSLAKRIATGFLNSVRHVFAEEQKLLEKYNAVELSHGGGGEYPNQDGFGWTNAVTLLLMDFEKESSLPDDGMFEEEQLQV